MSLKVKKTELHLLSKKCSFGETTAGGQPFQG